MQIHSLSLNSIDEEEYFLIAIHTTLEDYKLAYVLNKKLLTCFCKTPEELTIKQKKIKASFPIFKYENTSFEYYYYLIANSSKNENIFLESQLLNSSETKTYLIPEKKKVDYFLKITGEINSSLFLKILQKIKTIEQVITCYSINKNTLKTKEHLIF